MTRTAEIERLLRAGNRTRTRLLDVRWLESPAGQLRVAIVVPKFGFTAVRRNKLKRRLRELARVYLLPHECSRDLILRARHETYEASFEKLRDEIHVVASQLT